MKTLSNLLRDIFSAHRTDKERDPICKVKDNNNAKTEPPNGKNSIDAPQIQDTNQPEVNQTEKTKEDNQHLLTQNPIQNETETDEISGDPNLDHSTSRETDGSDQELQKAGQSKSGYRPGCPGDLNPGEKKWPEVETESGEVSQDERTKEAIQEAYLQGVIAGRNAQIEEKYFPKTDDGIPCFHGNACKTSSGNDIFSLAREA